MEPKGSEPAKSKVPICRAVIKFLIWQVRKHIGNLFGSIFLLFSLETFWDRGQTYSRGSSVWTVEDGSQERHAPHFAVQGGIVKLIPTTGKLPLVIVTARDGQ